jgi:hypothetical protein
MNKIQKILTVVALLAFSAINSSIADKKWDWEVRNGNWWRTQSKEVRAIYITGMNDGILTGIVMVSEEDTAIAERLRTSAVMSLITGQCVAGMNRLYSDQRNLGIDSSLALHIVHMQLIGAPESQVQTVIELSRQVAADFEQSHSRGGNHAH